MPASAKFALGATLFERLRARVMSPANEPERNMHELSAENGGTPSRAGEPAEGAYRSRQTIAPVTNRPQGASYCIPFSALIFLICASFAPGGIGPFSIISICC